MLKINDETALLVIASPKGFAYVPLGRARVATTGHDPLMNRRVYAISTKKCQDVTAGGAVEALPDTGGTTIPHILDGMQCG